MHVGDDPKTSSTYLVTIVGFVLLLAVVVVAQLVTLSVQRYEDERKQVSPRPRELTELQAQQMGAINEYRLVNPQSGVVRIPIDRAIELYVDELKSATASPTITPVPDRPGDLQPTGKTQ